MHAPDGREIDALPVSGTFQRYDAGVEEELHQFQYTLGGDVDLPRYLLDQRRAAQLVSEPAGSLGYFRVEAARPAGLLHEPRISEVVPDLAVDHRVGVGAELRPRVELVAIDGL